MTVLPRDLAWTFSDLEALPDDGLRYELVDGTLLVSPAPTKTHQRCQANLFRLIDPVVPKGFEILLAPTDYRPTSSRSLQPDLLVVSRADPGDAAVTTPLLLAVEVISPSSRNIDLLLKRGLYEQAGVRHYWAVDPYEQRITAWSLADGLYGEGRSCHAEEPLVLTIPFRVTVVPSELLH